jgi:hypothetical protein
MARGFAGLGAPSREHRLRRMGNGHKLGRPPFVMRGLRMPAHETGERHNGYFVIFGTPWIAAPGVPVFT